MRILCGRRGGRGRPRRRRVSGAPSPRWWSGMRPEEMIALRWSDNDLASGVARIQRVRTFQGSEREGSKTHAERDVDLVGAAPRSFARNEAVHLEPTSLRAVCQAPGARLLEDWENRCLERRAIRSLKTDERAMPTSCRFASGAPGMFAMGRPPHTRPGMCRRASAAPQPLTVYPSAGGSRDRANRCV